MTKYSDHLIFSTESNLLILLIKVFVYGIIQNYLHKICL